MENEIWKDIIGYEGYYQISTLGRVKSFFFHGKPVIRIIIPTKTITQHCYVSLNKTHIRGKQIKKTYGVHRLVALTFIENNDFNKTEVNHIDHNGSNNCIDNLEWVSHKENILHSYLNPKRKSLKLLKTLNKHPTPVLN